MSRTYSAELRGSLGWVVCEHGTDDRGREYTIIRASCPSEREAQRICAELWRGLLRDEAPDDACLDDLAATDLIDDAVFRGACAMRDGSPRVAEAYRVVLADLRSAYERSRESQSTQRALRKALEGQ